MTRTVLVIEDTPEVLENLTAILNLRTYHVLHTLNGRSGIELAILKRPDIILCDIAMPGVNGHDVLKAIRNIPHTRNIPFIFITSQDEQRNYQQADEMDVDGYIIKPFESEKILDRLEFLMRSRPKHSPVTVAFA
jgi:CheY-like chemotaxis protein